MFKDAGVDVTVASPKGGPPPLDPASNSDDSQTAATHRFKNDAAAQHHLSESLVLESILPDDLDALFYPGGHGPLWDLAENFANKLLIESFAVSDRPVGAVCHAPAVFKNALGSDGQALVKEKTVTGFSNTEEESVGLAEVVPFLVEDMLKANGGRYRKGDDWNSFVAVDGNLVTGQNPASSEATARALMGLL